MKQLKFLLITLIILVLPKIGSAADGTDKLIIFHTNDMHARVMAEDDGGQSIGLAEMAAAVKAVKSNSSKVFWFDAGDTLHGMPRINISRGENIIPLLNAAGIDALVPGNHDFNYGSAQLEALSKKMLFPVLSANIVDKNTGKRLFRAYRIYKLDSGVKVGVFGLSTPECAYKTNPSNVTNVEFLNPIDTAREMVRKLRKRCDVVIAVMHMGVDESSEFTSERIAREVPGIDLIVDGHSHTTLPEGLTVNNTLIVQTGWHEYKLGCVEIDLRDHKIISKKAELLDADDVKKLAPIPDEKIAYALAAMEERNEKLFNEVVAHSDRFLTADRLILRRGESEIGNLCADALRWRTGADIAIMNGGGMRTDLPAGDVTLGNVMAIFPFGNTVRKAEIDGKTIRAMLEHSVYGYPASFGGFLNVSGMSFSFDPTKPVGHRVEDIFINGKPVDDNKIYTMAATDFQFAGGDDYDMLKNLKIVGEYDTCEGVLTDYLNEVGMSGIGLGRINVLRDVEIPADIDEREAA